MKKLELKTV